MKISRLAFLCAATMSFGTARVKAATTVDYLSASVVSYAQLQSSDVSRYSQSFTGSQVDTIHSTVSEPSSLASSSAALGYDVSPSSGTFTLSGSSQNGPDPLDPRLNSLSQESIKYGFTIDTASKFMLSYDVIPGGVSGAGASLISTSGQDSLFDLAFVSSGDGQRYAALAPGSYILSLSDNSYAFGIPSGQASNLSRFSFSISSISSAVPEPSSWVLMILGFATVGVFLRRRCKTDAYPRLAWL